MVSNARLSGFNMSFFLNPTAAKEKAQEAFKEEPIDDKKVPQKKDKIQEYCTKNTLQDHPEVVTQLLTEMNLLKFWKSIMADPETQVFEALACDRILNFYDASVKGSLTHRETRLGMMTAILTSSYTCMTRRREVTPVLKNASSVIPCFMHESSLDIAKYKVKDFSESDIKEVERLVKLFTRAVPDRKKLKGAILDVYLMESFKMWVISKDSNVIEFMMARDRGNFITKEAVYSRLKHQHHLLGFCDSSVIRSAPEFTIFNTVWGRTRAWNHGFQLKTNDLLRRI